MSGRGALHPASDSEAEQIWPAVAAAHLFDTRERFARFRAEAPWRVQVTGRGEAVVLERWRATLDILAVRGLWCGADRVPDLLRQVKRLAAGYGFGRLLSPLVAEEVAPLYERAGLGVHESIVALRLERRSRLYEVPSVVSGVRFRGALADDLAAVVRIDAECFDEFWRYDSEYLAHAFVEDRLAVAEGAEGVIGYTLSTVVGSSGTLGRLAVTPSERHRGVGRALLHEALAHLVRSGSGTISVCTQEDNLASRSLYRRAGLTELSGRLVFLLGTTGGKPSDRE